ncbi:ABC transporter substrate-binding protein [Flavobacterium sp. 3HN19-14]|uniref:ABC transporter substrate-binding protein n=1 Tax=Flavobacterium sp. 3HN19-14 TaxID=3448133 RepID=UPI003EE1496B
MSHLLRSIVLVAFVISLSGCKKDGHSKKFADAKVENAVQYASGLAIYKHEGFSIVKIKNPWPNASKDFTYILKEKTGIIPDSLKSFTTINVPIQSIVVTSTTHIPSLEMLGVENTLKGFPNTDYISSAKVRALIDAGKVRELGSNQTLNTEVLIDIAPDVIIGFGIDNNNPTLDNLQKSGLKVMLNGDWNEQNPLGKAEWIKFFGALYGKEKLADSIFSGIEKEYKATVEIAKKATTRPTVLIGAMYKDIWYIPNGTSWGSRFVKDAGGDYLWKDARGTGSLSLSFEAVFDKAQHADFWINESSSLEQMSAENPHYAQFDAFKNKKVYSFTNLKGKTGGIVYYELAPNRPDLVLKDMLKILHPELLPDHQLYFFTPLK